MAERAWCWWLLSGWIFLTCVLAGLLFVACGCKKTTIAPSAPASAAPASTWIEQNNRGVGLMGWFEFDAAAKAFDAISAGREDRPAVLVNEAIALLNRRREGDVQQAEAIFDRVLARQGGDLRAIYCKALLRLNAGKTADALEGFRKVIAADPNDAYAAYFSGRCLASLGKPAEALAEYQRTIRLDPLLRSAHYGAFQTLQQLGRNDEANVRLAEFQRLADDPRATLAELKYTRMGSKAEAMTVDLAAGPAAAAPAGPVFLTALPLRILKDDGVVWRKYTGTGPRPTITAADINGDGRLDLFITSALEADGQIRNAVLIHRDNGFELDVNHPLAKVTNVNAAVWGDFDNDGLVDVYLCRHGPNQLWRQTKAGDWRDITESSHASGGDFNTIDAAAVDADHDGDLDLFLIRADGKNELLNNNLDGTFTAIGEKAGIAGDGRESSGLAIADLNHDGLVDLVVLKAKPPHEVFLNEGQWKYHRGTGFEEFLHSPASAAIAADVECGGQVAIFAMADGQIVRWKPDEKGQWRSTPIAIVAAPGRSSRNIPAMALADLTGSGSWNLLCSARWSWTAISDLHAAPVSPATDGNDRRAVPALHGASRPSIAELSLPPTGNLTVWSVVNLDPAAGVAVVGLSSAGGPPIIWKPGPGRFPFVGLELSGRNKPAESIRSNVSGVGVTIAARTGSRWTAASTFRNQSGPGQSLYPLSLGTGPSGKFDFVRLTWPDGLQQTELDLPAGKLSRISEVQRQTSSCPVIFAWDGSRYAFITDCLGAGGIGFATGAGEYAPVRPDENVLLPEGLPKSKDGRMIVKISEPMEEACYLDSASLVSYDLPPGWSMTLDERMAVNSPQPTGEPTFYRTLLLPSRAVNDRGNDVTAAIASVDGIAAEPGERDHRFIGFTREHFVEMTFDVAWAARPCLPAPDTGGPPVPQLLLIADGWIEYPYSQTMFAASQARAPYRAPTLEACGADGKWVVVLDQFGYPAGMPRQISVPIPLEKLPPGTTQLRLRTTQEIYWDRLALAWAEPCPQAIRHVLKLSSATLADVGFPLRTTGPQHRPLYDYARRLPLWDMHAQPGWYTALGRVDELVGSIDSACAIFGPGEEVELQFVAPKDPPPAGWRRQYVLELAGWCKDRDLYTKDGRTLEPAPVREGASAKAMTFQNSVRTRAR